MALASSKFIVYANNNIISLFPSTSSSRRAWRNVRWLWTYPRTVSGWRCGRRRNARWVDCPQFSNVHVFVRLTVDSSIKMFFRTIGSLKMRWQLFKNVYICPMLSIWKWNTEFSISFGIQINTMFAFRAIEVWHWQMCLRL